MELDVTETDAVKEALASTIGRSFVTDSMAENFEIALLARGFVVVKVLTSDVV